MGLNYMQVHKKLKLLKNSNKFYLNLKPAKDQNPHLKEQKRPDDIHFGGHRIWDRKQSGTAEQAIGLGEQKSYKPSNLVRKTNEQCPFDVAEAIICRPASSRGEKDEWFQWWKQMENHRLPFLECRQNKNVYPERFSIVFPLKSHQEPVSGGYFTLRHTKKEQRKRGKTVNGPAILDKACFGDKMRYKIPDLHWLSWYMGSRQRKHFSR